MVVQIKEGMPQDEVRQFLDAPNNGMSDNSWSYGRFMNLGWLVVYFDSNGSVEYVDHELAFP